MEDLSNNLDELINKIKVVFEEINKNKEELKLKIQKIFTRIRNAINDREDELLIEVDKKYEEININENIINDNDKFKNKMKISLERGKIIDKDWNDENKLISSINNCIDIENNIREITKINENKKNFENFDNIKIIFSPEEDSEINKYLLTIKTFGKIINNEIGFILDSLIVKSNNLFLEKVKKKINSSKEIKATLLYRKSKDGDSVKSFHNLCDNKGPTLTLIESSTGFIIGGYTPLKWDNYSSWKNDNETFLFSLSNNKIFIKKKLEYSIYCDEKYGPWFAFIGLEKNMKNGRFATRTNQDEFPFEDYNKIIPNGNSDQYFKVKEVEVYKISSI